MWFQALRRASRVNVLVYLVFGPATRNINKHDPNTGKQGKIRNLDCGMQSVDRIEFAKSKIALYCLKQCTLYVHCSESGNNT